MATGPTALTTSRLKQSSRFWVAGFLAIVIFAQGFFFLHYYPAEALALNPANGLFVGEAESSIFFLSYAPAFRIQGQLYAYRGAMLLLVLCFLFFVGFRKGTENVLALSAALARAEATTLRPSVMNFALKLVLGIIVAKAICLWFLGVFLFPAEIALAVLISALVVCQHLSPRKWPFSLRRVCDFAFGRIGAWVVGGALVLSLLPAFCKIPDLSTGVSLAELNIHFTYVLGHGDRLAAGDVLFKETAPLYGPGFAVVLGAVESRLGLLDLGTILRVLIGFEVVFLSIAVFLFGKWARGRWLLGAIPILLLAPFYCSFDTGPMAPNHNPLRFFGMPLGLLGLWLTQSVKPVFACLTSGFLGAVAVIWNPETGVATSAGLIVFHVLRFDTGGANSRMFSALTGGLAGATGFAAGLAFFGIATFFAVGPFPFDIALDRVSRFARVAPYGLPYAGDALPVILFLFTAIVFSFTALQRRPNFRDCFRGANCAIILVWFSYFVNRPQMPEYLASFYFPFGFLIIDAGHRLWTLAQRGQRATWTIEAVLALLLFAVVIPQAVETVVWSWTGNGLPHRWSVPLVPASVKQNVPIVSGVYLAPGYAADLLGKADFLREKANAGRPIYFTIESYLMPRISGIVPLQEFTDPLEAVDKTSYDRLVHGVITSARTELFFEARDEPGEVKYGGYFRLLRRDLSKHFFQARTERGWEVWARIPN